MLPNCCWLLRWVTSSRLGDVHTARWWHWSPYSIGIPRVTLLLNPQGGKEIPIYTFKQDGCKKTTALHCSRFALYKLPKHAKGDIPMLGLEYMYMDALAPQWQLSKYLINMTQGALGQTLKQLYETYESEASDI